MPLIDNLTKRIIRPSSEIKKRAQGLKDGIEFKRHANLTIRKPVDRRLVNGFIQQEYDIIERNSQDRRYLATKIDLCIAVGIWNGTLLPNESPTVERAYPTGFAHLDTNTLVESLDAMFKDVGVLDENLNMIADSKRLKVGLFGGRFPGSEELAVGIANYLNSRHIPQETVHADILYPGRPSRIAVDSWTGDFIIGISTQNNGDNRLRRELRTLFTFQRNIPLAKIRR